MTIRSILIANRGEIACRVMRTAHSMGIKTFALYIDEDKKSPHVNFADHAIKIQTNYMDMDAVINVAKSYSIDAIHPGYGFLSENASFARKVQSNKIIWIGPTPTVIKKMGDKLQAKEIAKKVNIPTLDTVEKVSLAKKIGFPLMIKAAAGGGGKGMRIVKDSASLKDAASAAKREALSGFGDDRIFFERYIEKSRHIEVQILGDDKNVVHLGERECSIQRRHQKIIEESPSTRLSEELRLNICEDAKRIAQAIKYTSAGTVEFLLDDKTGEYWFLEVNTRLQVEHPVTEEVTGIDIVQEQINIANKKSISFLNNDAADLGHSFGHSIEVRIYAENPENDFLPETGEIFIYQPSELDGIRWESGINSGTKITTNFDPMLSKVISWAETRDEAAAILANALEKTIIGGVKTNKDFLINCLRNKDFIDGKTTSDFISKSKPSRGKILLEEDEKKFLIIAAIYNALNNQKKLGVLNFVPAAWTNGRIPKQRIKLELNGKETEVSYKYLKDGSIDILDTVSTVISLEDNKLIIEIDSEIIVSSIHTKENKIVIGNSYGSIETNILPRFKIPGANLQEDGLVAPMPGKVIDIQVKKGQKIKKGQSILIIEAMKMEQTIKSPKNSKVKQVLVSKLQQVENGELLVILDD